jgi:uncharacterized RDD family membrane protein YckC
MATPMQAWTTQARELLQHAGRILARAILDGTPLPRLAATVLHDPGWTPMLAAIRATGWAVAGPALLAFVLLWAILHLLGECSPWQASPGKRGLGLHVADSGGRRIGPGRSLLRFGAGALSWLTLNLGHLMATAPPDHLALHDRCSGTRVRAAHDRLPRWALAWLALLAIAGLVGGAWLSQLASEVVRAALERALFPPG